MQPFPVPFEPGAFSPQYSLRVRREIATRDTANIRQFEHWQTDGPQLNLDRPDLSGNPIFGDMNPTISRRTPSQLYRQSQTYIPGRDSFTQNPYFEKYPPAFDPRNAIREVRSSVFEDTVDRGIEESRKILSRGFDTAWVAQDVVQEKNLASLRAFEELRPQFNDMTKDYRK